MENDIEKAERLNAAKMACKYAMELFSCKSYDELKGFCNSLIEAADYIRDNSDAKVGVYILEA